MTSRPATLAVDSALEGGTRRWGRPKSTWQDTFKDDMKAHRKKCCQ